MSKCVISEEARNLLLQARLNGIDWHVDALVDCLERAKGVARLMHSAADMANYHDRPDELAAKDVVHAAEVLAIELSCALVLVNDWDDQANKSLPTRTHLPA